MEQSGAQRNKGRKKKMTIEIIESLMFVSGSTTYDCLKLKCDKHETTITRTFGRSNYINVTVHNSSNRVWRGMGKQFNNTEEALKAYKNPKIRAMIEFQPEA